MGRSVRGARREQNFSTLCDLCALCGASLAGGAKGDLLDAPVGHLTNQQLVLIAAVD
jgi:hypothetical protein